MTAMTEDEYESACERADAELRTELTEVFLDTLVKAARTVGWAVDHTETYAFVRCCFEIAGAEFPESLDPFVVL